MAIRITNLKSFNAQVKSFGEDLMPDEHLKLQKTIAIDLLRRIVFRTPVDTGRARGNWQVARGPSTNATVDQLDKRGVSVLAQGVSTIAFATEPYGLITIFNNVKYAPRLEAGGSQQAPRGMVALSIAETEAQF